MTQIRLTVCDVCEDMSRGTRNYTITTSDGRKGKADLCEEHARPLEHLLGDPKEVDTPPPPTPIRTTAKKTAAKKTTARRRTSMGARIVKSVEEIEKLKK